MSQNNPSGESITAQPLLPRVSLIWSFVAITAAAILISLSRWAGEGQALITAILATLSWLAGLFAIFGLMFLVSYSLGSLEVLLAPPEEEVLSPFAGDRLPEQIVTPAKVDDK